uniref:Leucine-rich repeat-containing N-terminal plant-type domain-containing protein n=1 Tax=Lactuca sativa TaxID=4236 RepID=A0A9R1WPG1_LACSA|nr:hypothetical protein LSAT_V11C100024160 [Lactuca sativa]
MSGTLPSCLGILCKTLMALKLRRNNFHGNMMNAFLTGDPLTKLDLSENRFSGQLPRSLTNCTNLEILTLEDNSFHDTFPSWLGTLSKLQVLVLRSNKLYGSIQGSTAVSLQFPKLRIIDLSNNNFSGQLHQNYFQTWHAMRSANLGISSVMKSNISSKNVNTILTYSVTLIHNGLQAFNLSNNNFTGHVLPTLGNLENLEALDLSRNKLSGEIPQQLVQLGYFSIFNVSFNHLDGHIPQGKQFDTFENDSYEGNPRLCGQPLSKKCQYSKVSTLPPTSNVSESLLPSERIDWIIILCGVGSGLAVGIVIGSILYTRYSDRITKRKDRWVRPLRVIA